MSTVKSWSIKIFEIYLKLLIFQKFNSKINLKLIFVYKHFLMKQDGNSFQFNYSQIKLIIK